MSIHEIPALRLLPSDVDDQVGPPFLFIRGAPTVPGPYGVPRALGLPTAIGMHLHSRNSRSTNVNRPSVTSFVVCRRGLLRNSLRGVLPGQESPYRVFVGSCDELAVFEHGAGGGRRRRGAVRLGVRRSNSSHLPDTRWRFGSRAAGGSGPGRCPSRAAPTTSRVS